MTRTLLLLRHAKSSWDEPGLRDSDRPLNERGERAAPRMGQWLAEQGLVPDVVLSSTAQRARRTAELAVEGGGFDVEIAYVEDLYLANPSTIVSTASRRGGEARVVLLVAHNPGCAELVEHVSDEAHDFPTGALARIEFEAESWSEVDLGTAARLVALWRPKELP